MFSPGPYHTHQHTQSPPDTPSSQARYDHQRHVHDPVRRQVQRSTSSTSTTGNLIAVLKVVVKDILSSAEDQQELPEEFSVLGSYPNPFRSTTRVMYYLPEPAEVHAEVFDILGRLAYTSQVQNDVAGWDRTLRLEFPATSSGLYIYRITMKTVSKTSIKTEHTVRIQ